MGKINCWEFKKCGREQGGPNSKEFGVCVAYTEVRTDGIHSGKNGGRTCWVIAGTQCGGRVQGTFAQKLRNCLECDFFKAVASEEEWNLMAPDKILALLG